MQLIEEFVSTQSILDSIFLMKNTIKFFALNLNLELWRTLVVSHLPKHISAKEEILENQIICDL